MKKRFVFSAFLALVFAFVSEVSANAQFIVDVEGVVYDEKTEEPIVGATVLFREAGMPPLGTTTDVNGYFHFGFGSESEYWLEFSCVGYIPQRYPESGTLPRSVNCKIYLKEDTIELGTVGFPLYGISDTPYGFIKEENEWSE